MEVDKFIKLTTAVNFYGFYNLGFTSVVNKNCLLKFSYQLSSKCTLTISFCSLTGHCQFCKNCLKIGKYMFSINLIIENLSHLKLKDACLSIIQTHTNI